MLGFHRGLSASVKNCGSISRRAALFINECQKDQTKEENKERLHIQPLLLKILKQKETKQIGGKSRYSHSAGRSD